MTGGEGILASWGVTSCLYDGFVGGGETGISVKAGRFTFSYETLVLGSGIRSLRGGLLDTLNMEIGLYIYS